jgi:hypothetical protein
MEGLGRAGKKVWEQSGQRIRLSRAKEA